MPPYKQPTLLRDLALQKAVEFIGNICLKISNGKKRLTQHEHDDCYDKASRLREYLVPIVCPLMDEICAYGPLDYEVWLLTFMHKNMKSLTCKKYPLHIKSLLYHTSLFWKKNLINVPNLKEFEYHAGPLSKNTFQILSQNCHHLEILKFDFEYSIERDTEDLNYLKCIKTLRIIKNTGFTFSNTRAGENLSRGLLENLPKLEYLSCEYMSQVLTRLKNVSSLPLTDVRDSIPTVKGVEAIARLCQNLESLFVWIHVPTQGDGLDDTITCLAESSLKITSLRLTLTSSSFLTRPTLFYKKGMFIKSLTIDSTVLLTCKHIITIGENCPELEKFALTNIAVRDPEINLNVPYQGSQQIFVKLLNFISSGTDPILVQVCLMHALNIQCIHFSSSLNEEEIGYKMISENIKGIHMPELQSLYIDFFKSEYDVSQDLVIYFLNAFPKLVKLSLLFMKKTSKLQECLQRLSEEILHKNLDLDLQYTFKH